MDVRSYLAASKNAFVEDLRRLVEIDSVRKPAQPGMPFGPGGANVLAAAQELLAAHGYQSVNYDNYALEADLGPAPSLMLLAHLDVVPVGDGWTREPFALTLEGGLAYGRGATDDKGAAVACLYAMDACRAFYGMPKTGVRLVLGSAEETGSEDMQYYFGRRPNLPFTLSPDAEYPLINIEKGHYAPYFTKRTENTGAVRLISFTGGDTQNIVPGKAEAKVAGLAAADVLAAADAVTAATGVVFTAEDTPGGCLIRAAGISAHASLPHKGKNAQTALLALLDALPLDKNETVAAIASLCALFPHGQTDGGSLGLAMEDHSGPLTLNFGVLKFEDGLFTCGADMRTPVCADGIDVPRLFAEQLAPHGFALTGKGRCVKAHCVPSDSVLVQTCLDVYHEYTGLEGGPLAIGGGTYVHEIEGGIAFGIEFPGKDYRIHGADEYADVDELLLTAAMYAEVIHRLCYGETADEG